MEKIQELMDQRFDKDIITAKKCPYCGGTPEFVSSSSLYYKDYGMVYLCKPCHAWVGVHHKTSTKALGRLANAELRKAKIRAHAYFDQLWRKKQIKSRCSKKDARTAAYKWLSEQLNISIKYTHIGMFDIELCEQVVELCKPYYNPHLKLVKN